MVGVIESRVEQQSVIPAPSVIPAEAGIQEALRCAARRIIRVALDNPVGSPPLRDIARGRRSAAILIPGKTRVAGTQDYLPLLLQELNEGGIDDDNIEVFLATGT